MAAAGRARAKGQEGQEGQEGQGGGGEETVVLLLLAHIDWPQNERWKETGERAGIANVDTRLPLRLC
jgi:hypothetical protein